QSVRRAPRLRRRPALVRAAHGAAFPAPVRFCRVRRRVAQAARRGGRRALVEARLERGQPRGARAPGGPHLGAAHRAHAPLSGRGACPAGGRLRDARALAAGRRRGLGHRCQSLTRRSAAGSAARGPRRGGRAGAYTIRASMQALSIRNLSKTYPNGVRALKGIDFDVEQGDFYALLGPNGAGKSTTIGIVSSLVKKSGGEVRVFGHDIDRELEAAKRCIGLVPQEINLNLFDTVENIVLNQAGYYGIPRRLAKERAEKYLNELRLWDRRH